MFPIFIQKWAACEKLVPVPLGRLLISQFEFVDSLWIQNRQWMHCGHNGDELLNNRNRQIVDRSRVKIINTCISSIEMWLNLLRIIYHSVMVHWISHSQLSSCCCVLMVNETGSLYNTDTMKIFCLTIYPIQYIVKLESCGTKKKKHECPLDLQDTNVQRQTDSVTCNSSATSL